MKLWIPNKLIYQFSNYAYAGIHTITSYLNDCQDLYMDEIIGNLIVI